MTRILVVEDEESLSEAIAFLLSKEGFEVEIAATGPAALEKFDLNGADLILLDLMLPGLSGTEVCRQIRNEGHQIGVLFLSAKDEMKDKVQGLTIGGDDYMTKPFSLDEIVARIHAILRRTKAAEVEESVLEVGEIKINQDAHDVFVNGTLVDLSPTEYKLLRFLMSNPNRVLTKAQILDHVWEYDFNGEMGIVESYVSYLRKKLDPLTSEPLIQTKRGVGYMYKSVKNGK